MMPLGQFHATVDTTVALPWIAKERDLFGGVL